MPARPRQRPGPVLHWPLRHCFDATATWSRSPNLSLPFPLRTAQESSRPHRSVRWPACNVLFVLQCDEHAQRGELRIAGDRRWNLNPKVVREVPVFGVEVALTLPYWRPRGVRATLDQIQPLLIAVFRLKC